MARRFLLGFVLAATVLSAAAVLSAGSTDERPPGVAADHWISLSDRAGLLITHAPDPGKAGIWLNGHPIDEARSQLWVRVNGVWMQSHLEQDGPAIVPAI